MIFSCEEKKDDILVEVEFNDLKVIHIGSQKKKVIHIV